MEVITLNFMTLLGHKNHALAWASKYITKMSSVMSFTFNAVELCVVTLNDKPWTYAKDVCKALKYNKATKTADIVKHQENYAHKCQLTEFVSATNLMDWPYNSRKDDYYINEEGMYDLLFSSQQPKAKNFRKHCCNVMFPHIRQQLTERMVNDMRRDHQLAITDHYNQVQAIQYENCKTNSNRLDLE